MVRNRLHEGGLSTWCPVVGPVLTGLLPAAQLAFARECQNWQVHQWFSSRMRASSLWADVTDVKESGDAVGWLCCLKHHPAWAVWRWVSDGLGKNIFGGSPKVPLLLLCPGMKSPKPLSDLTLLQWALGSSFWMTKPSLVWPECVGSFWMMKALMPLTGPLVPQTSTQLRTSGHYVSEHPMLLISTTECPGAHWCPDQDLAGDPPGHHPPIHQDHI